MPKPLQIGTSGLPEEGRHTAFYAIGNAGASKTINFANGHTQSITIDQATTLTLSAPEPGKYVLKVTNGGAYTITWATTIKWAGKSLPTLTTSGYDYLGFIYDGTNWDCVPSLDFGTV